MRSSSSIKSVFAATLALFAICAIGCSDGLPQRVPVSGTVLVDGEPLNRGNLKFVPKGGRPSIAIIQDDGSFTLRCFDEDDGAIVGTHQVSISAKQFVTVNNIKWFAPAKYANHKTSGLTVEITEPTDDLTIELTWEGEKPNRT